MMQHLVTELLIIGGGINGSGIAADAAGRGLDVVLCEKGDLASGTSSYSTKLIHGGLRYLEYYEFKLVRESLLEREVLLKAAPHLIHPLNFIVPHGAHSRPAWLVSLGLFLYDHLAFGISLPRSKKINLLTDKRGEPLKKLAKTGFSYYDCRTDDARLVIANALSAKKNNAIILPRTRFMEAHRKNDHWQATLKNIDTNETYEIKAKSIVNAAGPWVDEVYEKITHHTSPIRVQKVKGSHIIVPKLYEGDHAYLLQHADKRVVFAIPYQQQFTLIGTTDISFIGDLDQISISDDEIHYLCNLINDYFIKNISPKDVVWAYSGVRALHDGKNSDPSKISRDYLLEVEDENKKAPLLSVFGGKITTYRTLSEHALNKLKTYFPHMNKAWTANSKLPGADLLNMPFNDFVIFFKEKYPWLPESLADRYLFNYGDLSLEFLNNATSLQDLGQHFGADLYQCEVDYLIEKEWAHCIEDIIWRRTKLGLLLNNAQQENLRVYLTRR